MSEDQKPQNSTTAKLYRFECPDCGFDDKEAGALAPEKAIYCGMCAGDNGRDVRLRRWLVEDQNG